MLMRLNVEHLKKVKENSYIWYDYIHVYNGTYAGFLVHI